MMLFRCRILQVFFTFFELEVIIYGSAFFFAFSQFNHWDLEVLLADLLTLASAQAELFWTCWTVTLWGILISEHAVLLNRLMNSLFVSFMLYHKVPIQANI